MKHLKFLWMDLNLYAYRIGRRAGLWSLLMCFVYPQTWANVQYRLQKFVYECCKIPLLRQLLIVIFFINGRIVKMLTGIEVNHLAEIGPGLYFAHTGPIIISMTSKIGHSCSIHHEVTLGTGNRDGFPEIGNAVYLGAGAKILGPVKIGSGSLIGANAVVTRDVPAFSTAAGVPARILKTGDGAGALNSLMVYPGLKVDGDMEGK